MQEELEEGIKCTISILGKKMESVLGCF